MITLQVNGTKKQVDVDSETPFLWVLRDNLGITSVKYACGVAECGICTVLIDGAAVRSCSIPVEKGGASEVTIVEGLSDDHPVKVAWIQKQVPQCGYCQPGIMLQAVDFLSRQPNPTDEQIKEAMDDVICLRLPPQDERRHQAGRRNCRQTRRLSHAYIHDAQNVPGKEQPGHCRYRAIRPN